MHPRWLTLGLGVILGVLGTVIISLAVSFLHYRQDIDAWTKATGGWKR